MIIKIFVLFKHHFLFVYIAIKLGQFFGIDSLKNLAVSGNQPCLFAVAYPAGGGFVFVYGYFDLGGGNAVNFHAAHPV